MIRMELDSREEDLFERRFDVKMRPGWLGAFTTRTAEGAIPSGSRVKKVNSETGDATADGSLGTVLGSIRHPALGQHTLYFVEWDHSPRHAVGVTGAKITPF